MGLSVPHANPPTFSRWLLSRFYGLVQDEAGPPMLVMEYGAKGSLYHYLHSDEDIPYGLRLRMAHELARGLACLHDQKIIHRDLKSLNVVLNQEYHIKICDFGLAKLKLHSKTTTKPDPTAADGIGTLRWMAPELFMFGSATPSFVSDIWALGMVWFEIMAREIPYKQAKTDRQIEKWITEGHTGEVSHECKKQLPGFENIMKRCWAERTARPTAEALVTDIQLLIEARATNPVSQNIHHTTNEVSNVTPSYHGLR